MRRFLSRYGSILVLLALCGYYSAVTLDEQHPVSPSAGRQVARKILGATGSDAPSPSVLIVVRPTVRDAEFASAVREELESSGASVFDVVQGSPVETRAALIRAGQGEVALAAVATHQPASEWGPLKPDRLEAMARQYPSLAGVRVIKPDSYVWPGFLTRQNLVNVVNQNAEVAIIAIGMTLVIITAGIDLSVGSLLALSGVIAAISIQHWAGGAQAGMAGVMGSCVLAVAAGGLCGLFNGLMVTWSRVPAFIATLSMMMIARGLALKAAVGYQSMLSGGTTEGTPEAVRIMSSSFGTLGNGELFGVPNPILLMLGLYAAAHVLMTRTSIGRYIYAVGGNPEAARLSGVPVMAILVLVYALCGMLAGLAGIIDASRFEGGRPVAGSLYELQVIAAVVVGGTSLAGGEGRIADTLIGALIIAVITNGLNVSGVKPFDQMIVFGAMILGAVLLDRLKRR